MKNLISCCIFAFMLTSACRYDTSDVKRIYTGNKAALEALRKAINEDKNIPLNKLIEPGQLSPIIQQQLEAINLKNVRYITVTSSCTSGYAIEIDFDRNSTLSYEPCGSGLPKGAHQTINLMETWNLGEQWILIENHDFIG